jgi:uncharacterized protein
MQVVGLWRYPVKSLGGEPLEEADVERDGLGGDRRWGIRDEQTGRILTARRRPPLLEATAHDAAGTPVIRLPDGRTAEGVGPGTDAVLTDWLGSPVSLVTSVRTRPGRAEFFADATDDDSEAVEWTMPAGRYVDAAPLLVLTTASLRAAEALYPAGSWVPRRFRPNVLLDVEGEGWLEDSWIGRPLQVGEATLAPVQGCIRCTMVTRPQPGLEHDVEIFRTLARHHGGLFGVWCDVSVPGRLRVGDEARVLGESESADQGELPAVGPAVGGVV